MVVSPARRGQRLNVQQHLYVPARTWPGALGAGGLHRNVGLVLATGMLPFVPRVATSLAKELI